MNNLTMERTDSSPEVSCTENGRISFVGRSYMETPTQFYSPIQNWCKDLNATNVVLHLELDYLNTTSSKCILKLILELEANNSIENLKVEWCYESDDEEMLEAGEIFEENTERAQFTYLAIEEVQYT